MKWIVNDIIRHLLMRIYYSIIYSITVVQTLSMYYTQGMHVKHIQ